ncbi:WecB/TagA/CpsF family glycosyltransferase [Roseibium denhamense]|nr:WecB/TagA/CpsF family glycosyltransferase [Roseibium denhamense]MTI05567.1 WecB/TagA/CpsF family glycosyltransferase [Roseibium denhamense]
MVETSVADRARLDIAICNAHTILTALNDPDYAAVLQQMTLLNDGVGADLVARILEGEGFPDNLNGTDLVPEILATAKIPLRLFLLGAKEERVREAKAHIERTFPKHEVVGVRDGYFDPHQVDLVCAEVNQARPDMLLIAMGNPRQEQFVTAHRQRLDVPVTVGVGALFDFMSGAVIRAPRLVRAARLEWLFRFAQEPVRLFHRYVVGIPRFFVLVAKLRLARSRKQAG